MAAYITWKALFLLILSAFFILFFVFTPYERTSMTYLTSTRNPTSMNNSSMINPASMKVLRGYLREVIESAINRKHRSDWHVACTKNQYELCFCYTEKASSEWFLSLYLIMSKALPSVDQFSHDIRQDGAVTTLIHDFGGNYYQAVRSPYSRAVSSFLHIHVRPRAAEKLKRFSFRQFLETRLSEKGYEDCLTCESHSRLQRPQAMLQNEPLFLLRAEWTNDDQIDTLKQKVNELGIPAFLPDDIHHYIDPTRRDSLNLWMPSNYASSNVLEQSDHFADYSYEEIISFHKEHGRIPFDRFYNTEIALMVFEFYFWDFVELGYSDCLIGMKSIEHIRQCMVADCKTVSDCIYPSHYEVLKRVNFLKRYSSDDRNFEY